jgi:hypothetical protein
MKADASVAIQRSNNPNGWVGRKEQNEMVDASNCVIWAVEGVTSTEWSTRFSEIGRKIEIPACWRKAQNARGRMVRP